MRIRRRGWKISNELSTEGDKGFCYSMSSFISERDLGRKNWLHLSLKMVLFRQKNWLKP